MGSGRTVVWFTGAECVVAFLAAVVAGWQLTLLFSSAILGRGFSGPDGGLDRVRLALVLAAAAVVIAPILVRFLGRSAGWAVVASGLFVSALVDGTLATLDLIVVDVLSALAITSGLVLGALVAMVPGGQRGRSAACAFGLAAGLPVAPVVVRLVSTATGASRWFFIAAPLAAAALALLSRRQGGRAAPASEPSDDPAVPAPLSAVLGPALVVSGAAVAVLVADVARQAVIDGIALSVDGVSTPRREQAVITVDWVARSTTALALGLVLIAYGYRRGRGQVGRWVSAGVGLMGLFAPVLQQASMGTAGAWLLVATVASVAGGGLVASRVADRRAPWDAVGLALAAIGLLLGLQQAASGLTVARSFHLSAYLVTTGCALTLGAGLGRLAASPDGARSIEARTGDAALGLATAVLTAGVIMPLWSPMVFAQPPGTMPPWEPSALVAAAALLVVLFFGFARAVDRVRRDIRAEAVGAPPPVG